MMYKLRIFQHEFHFFLEICIELGVSVLAKFKRKQSELRIAKVNLNFLIGELIFIIVLCLLWSQRR